MELGSRERGERKTSSAASNMNQNKSSRNSKAMAQYNADAGLLAEFEQSADSGKSFNYSRSVTNAPKKVPEEQIKSRGVDLSSPLVACLQLKNPLSKS